VGFTDFTSRGEYWSERRAVAFLHTQCGMEGRGGSEPSPSVRGNIDGAFGIRKIPFNLRHSID
jgi:hypothetical protein